MYSSYDIDLYSPAGVHTQSVEAFATLTLTRSVNTVGALTLTLPWSPVVWQHLPKDALIDVWRRRENGARQRVMNTLWLVSKRAVILATDGTQTIQVSAVDCIDLLRRWQITYDTATEQATKTAPAESVIKSVVSEQLVTRGGLPITVESDSSLGFSVSIAAGWQQVLSTVQSVAQTSTQYGSYMAFDFDPTAMTAWTFRTYLGQRGMDRSSGSAIPLTLSDKAGDVTSGTYMEDYSSCDSQVIALGQTAKGATTTATATDALLDGLGPFAHTESNTTMQNTTDVAYTLPCVAQAELRARRPSLCLSQAILPQSPSCQYGVQYDFGDKLSCSFAGLSFTAWLETLAVSVDASSGQETFTGTLNGVLS